MNGRTVKALPNNLKIIKCDFNKYKHYFYFFPDSITKIMSFDNRGITNTNNGIVDNYIDVFLVIRSIYKILPQPIAEELIDQISI